MSEVRNSWRAVLVFLIVVAMLAVLGFVLEPAKGAEAHPADFRVRTSTASTGPSNGFSSATVIDSGPSGSWLLTAAHVFRNDKRIWLLSPDDQTYGCNIVHHDWTLDLGLLWTSDLKDWSYRPIAMKYDPGKVWLTGWPGLGTKYRTIQTSKDRSSNYDNGFMGFWGESLQGQSGGAIVSDKGYLVGVISKSSKVDTIGAAGDELLEFVRHGLAQYQWQILPNGGYYEIQPCPDGNCQNPQAMQPQQDHQQIPGINITPTPAPQLQPIPEKDNAVDPERSVIATCNCDEKWPEVDGKLREVLGRLDVLEASKPKQPDLSGYAKHADVAAIEEKTSEQSSLLGKLQEKLTQGGGAVGWTLGKTAAAAVGLGGPVGLGLTLGGWLIGRRAGRRAGGRVKERFRDIPDY